MENNVSYNSFFSFDLYPPIKDNTDFIKNRSGCNQKATIIVYSVEERDVTLNDNLKLFLTKILQAINYDLEKDVLMVPIAKNDQIALNDLKKSFDMKYVLNFGVPLPSLGVFADQTKMYSPILLNEIIFVLAENLEKLSTDQQSKRQFWQCLQATFLK